MSKSWFFPLHSSKCSAQPMLSPGELLPGETKAEDFKPKHLQEIVGMPWLHFRDLFCSCESQTCNYKFIYLKKKSRWDFYTFFLTLGIWVWGRAANASQQICDSWHKWHFIKIWERFVPGGAQVNPPVGNLLLLSLYLLFWPKIFPQIFLFSVLFFLRKV